MSIIVDGLTDIVSRSRIVRSLSRTVSCLDNSIIFIPLHGLSSSIPLTRTITQPKQTRDITPICIADRVMSVSGIVPLTC